MNRFDWLRLIGPSIMDLFGRLLGRASLEGGSVGSELPPPLPKRVRRAKTKRKPK